MLFDETRPFRALAAAVIIRALQDVVLGRSCQCSENQTSHICANEAMAFLDSPGCKSVLSILGVDPDQLRRVLDDPDLKTKLKDRCKRAREEL